MSGIYVHIPFCSRFCTYCDFYSVVMADRMPSFVDALCLEAEQRIGRLNGAPRTLYLGGGTPSLLSLPLLERIVRKIDEVVRLRFGEAFSGFEEFTIETNPDDITPEYARGLKSLGINRVSMGIQSFDDEDLKWMNRRHDAAMAVQAYETLRGAGFANISLDLIFGYASLSMEKWERNVSRMIQLGPEHVSAYQMSIEPGSMLGRLYAKGKYDPPADEICLEQFRMLQRMLSDGGYIQYEISNYSRPGMFSRHNSSYWEGTEYLGLGPGAHSYDGKNLREWGVEDLNTYIDQLSAGEFEPEKEVLTAEDHFNERVMLGLRRVKGCSISELKSILPQEAEKLLRKVHLHIDREKMFHLEPTLLLEGDCLRIPESSFFISDSIISDLFV